MDFIVRVKVLKLHIHLAGALVKVKKVEQGVGNIIYDYKLLFAVVNGLDHIK